jgi:hypothetical protein
MEQQELRILLAQGCQFPRSFRAKVAGFVVGEYGALSSFVCQEAGLTAKGASSDGAWSHMVTSGVGYPEC